MEKKHEKKTKVKVVVRVRPSIKQTDAKPCVEATEYSVEIFNHRNMNENIKYDFGRVFDSKCTQLQLYNETVLPLLNRALHGENVSIFAYGPTGAGKTYTMLGSPSDPGIIPRSINGIFQLANEQNEMSSKQFKFDISFSYLEIYNEKVYDLLVPGSSDLPVREDGHHNIFVSGLAEKTISNFSDFKHLFGPASNNRTVAATKLNDYSSRSHSILLLKVKKTETSPLGKVHHGKIYLIDLAGSEDNRRTGNSGIRLKESGAINKSLFALGEVVDAINAGMPRIPYRNSKLTRLLQDSVGGSCHSVMITNIAPEEHYYYDTYCTLNFATKSKTLVNTVRTKQSTLSKPNSLSNKLKRSTSTPLHEPNVKRVCLESQQISLNNSDPMPNLSPLLRRHDHLEEKVNCRLKEMEKNIMKHIEKTKVSPDGSEVDAMEAIQKQLASLQDELIMMRRMADAKPKSAKQKTGKQDAENPITVKKKISSGNRKPMTDKTNQLEVPGVIICKTPIASNGTTTQKKVIDESIFSPLVLPRPIFTKGFRSTGAQSMFNDNDENITDSSARIKSDAQKKHNEEFLNLLNGSSVKELQHLHTVGSKRARLIYEWRELHGSFLKIDDLTNIPSFTNKYLQSLLHSNMVYVN